MDRIEQIINEWDPIGLYPMAPKDEYVEEEKKIVEYIEKWPNITEKKLADRINEIFIEAFGKDVYKEDMVACSYVARKIIDNLFI